MKAIILAAGRGSRMHEGTKDIPKCMMQVCGKTLIERCIDTLEQSGFDRKDIAIVTGYKHEKIEKEIVGTTFFHNKDWETTNMVYSLTKAESWLTKYECVVVYSDIIFSPKTIIRTINQSGDIVIPYYVNYLDLWKMRFENPLEDLETFKLDEEHYLKEIGNKPTSYEQIEGQYMGIVKLTPAGWEAFIKSIVYTSKTLEKMDMTTLLNGTLANNTKIRCVKSSELWLECDNQNDIRLYEQRYGII